MFGNKTHESSEVLHVGRLAYFDPKLVLFFRLSFLSLIVGTREKFISGEIFVAAAVLKTTATCILTGGHQATK